MYLVPLMLLALASGGVQRGSCYPSSTLGAAMDYLRSLTGDYIGYIDSASTRLKEIRNNGLRPARDKEMEAKILEAFLDLRPVAKLECYVRINSKLETMKEVLQEGTSATGVISITPDEIDQLESIVFKMAKNYYEKCFEQQTAEIRELSKKFDSFKEAINRMEGFEKFANFSLTVDPLESFKLQADRVLTMPEYSKYLQTISNQLDSKAPKSPDGGPFSDSCGYLKHVFPCVLDYGIRLLEGAASFELDLASNHPDLQYYRNYALCIVSREYLMEEKKKQLLALIANRGRYNSSTR